MVQGHLLTKDESCAQDASLVNQGIFSACSPFQTNVLNLSKVMSKWKPTNPEDVHCLAVSKADPTKGMEAEQIFCVPLNSLSALSSLTPQAPSREKGPKLPCPSPTYISA